MMGGSNLTQSPGLLRGYRDRLCRFRSFNSNINGNNYLIKLWLFTYYASWKEDKADERR